MACAIRSKYNVLIEKRKEVLYMKFYEILRQLRNKHQLSQEELAEKLGVSRQAVAKWEAGNTIPDLTNLIIISDLFKVSLDRLLKEQDNDCSKSIMKTHEGLNELLLRFLFVAKRKTYAAGAQENAKACRPNSHDLRYDEGDLCYIDTYLGSENFSGQEAIWNKGVPIWSMNYIGRVISEDFRGDFLKLALTVGTQENVVRGPQIFHDGDFTYHCEYNGDIDWFHGKEVIYYLNQIVYECYFHGGIVKE